VTELARTHTFGDLVSARHLANPVATAVGLFVVAAVGAGLLFGVGAIGEHTDGLVRSLLRFLALLGCFTMVGALAGAIGTLARGAQSFYIFTNGVVHRRNGKVHAYSWNELSELRAVIGTKGDQAGKILHYRLTPSAGTAMAIPMQLVDGRDEFMDNLIGAMRYHGRPVN
jgi:hypothetical protein